jgi:hypothetical protein
MDSAHGASVRPTDPVTADKVVFYPTPQKGGKSGAESTLIKNHYFLSSI